jgi:hypothetical protein
MRSLGRRLVDKRGHEAVPVTTGANMNAESRPAFVATHLIVARSRIVVSHQPARSWCELADPGRKIGLWFPSPGFASIAAQTTLLLASCIGMTAFLIGALSVSCLSAAVARAVPYPFVPSAVPPASNLQQPRGVWRRSCRSSKPAGRGSPPLGRFDSFAASLDGVGPAVGGAEPSAADWALPHHS